VRTTTGNVTAAIAAVLSMAVAGAVLPAGGDISGYPSVTDGDTIRIGSTRIRLQGVDAPESNVAAGQQSKIAMTRIVAGHLVTCRPDGTRSHDRVVAICHLEDGTDIGAEIIREGWALDCPHFSGGRYHQFEKPVPFSPASYCRAGRSRQFLGGDNE
jgi:endonuclease YncB( thermonuclease family)